MRFVVSARQEFGEWGLDLSTTSFAAALVELGVAAQQPGNLKDHLRLGRVLLQHQLDQKRLQRSPLTLVWSDLNFWINLKDPQNHQMTARSWAIAWGALTRELSRAQKGQKVPKKVRIRLEVRTNAQGGDALGGQIQRLEPHWLIKTLLDAPLVSSVTFLASEPEQPLPWDWPINVAFLDDESSRQLRRDLEGQYREKFVRFCQASQATSQIDLLLLPFDVSDAIAAFLRSRRATEVHTILALGGSRRARDPLALLDALRREAGALAAGVCQIAPEKRHEWLDDVLFRLSHDHTLDEALFGARDSSKGVELPLLIGSIGALASARASVAAVHVCAHAKAYLSDERGPYKVMDSDFPGVTKRGAAASRPSYRMVVERLGNSPEDLPWNRKGEAASAIASVADAASKGSSPKSDSRFVQGRIFALKDGVESRITKAVLPAATAFRLDIRIAAPDADWAQAPKAFPVHRLPPDANGHLLTVVFVDPGLLPEPIVDTLWLPALGDSGVCRFYFSTGRSPKHLDARVTVLYRNRILQTLRLRAPLARDTDASEAAQGLQIELETVLRQELYALSGSPRFDAALLQNDTTTGTPGLTTFQDKKAAYVNLQSLEQVKRRLRDELEKITARPTTYGDPDSEATRALLVTLARLGRGFYDAFAELPGIGALLANAADAPERRPRRFQLLSMHADDLLSLEFCYDRDTPDEDAKACPEWPEVLNGRPTAAQCCQGRCPQDLMKTVCPLGFWGLVDTIERHMYDPEKAAEIQSHGAEFEVRCEAVDARRSLLPLRRVLMGAADKARDFNPAEFQTALDSMKASLGQHGGQMIEVGSWGEWETAISSPNSPDLLLLIAHTADVMGASVLQIGSENMPSTRIKAPQVHLPPVVPPDAGPLVLLFGCRTATVEVPFSSFIRAFRKAGAAVVVATLSTVRGRHMAPAAKETLAVLLEHADSESESFGDVLVGVRRRLLAKGMPVGLTFVAYGDASWQLGRMT